MTTKATKPPDTTTPASEKPTEQPSAFTTTQAQVDEAKEPKPETADAPSLAVFTAISALLLKQNNYIPAVNDLNIPLASDLANGNAIPCTGQEILLAYNSDTVLHHFTVTSTPDLLGRTGDITAYIINPSTLCGLQLSQITGWKQSDGTIHISCDNALVKFAVIIKN